VNLPERMTRRIAVPHQQVRRAVAGLRSGHVEFEHRHPHLVPGTDAAGLAVYRRISDGRETGRRGLQVVPARRVLRQRVVRRVQPSAARVPYPKLAPFVLRVLDRFALHEVHLKRVTTFVSDNNGKQNNYETPKKRKKVKRGYLFERLSTVFIL